MRRLEKRGEISGGKVVHISSIPVQFLRDVPLVEGVLIDRHVVLLAEATAVLTELGYAPLAAVDEHILAHVCWGQDGAPNSLLTFADLQAALCAATGLLKKYSGRATEVEGRPYWHIDDYRSWNERRLRGPLEVQEGMIIDSWNEWIERRGGEGKAKIGKVRAQRILHLADRNMMWILPDAEEAHRRQEARWRLLRNASRWVRPPLCVGDTSENESDKAESSFEADVTRCRTQLLNHAFLILLYDELAKRIVEEHFDGHSVLFPDVEHDLSLTTKMLESVAALYKDALLRRFDLYANWLGADGRTDNLRVDLEKFRSGLQPHVLQKEKELLALAESDALLSLGDHAEAQAIMVATFADRAEE